MELLNNFTIFEVQVNGAIILPVNCSALILQLCEEANAQSIVSKLNA